MNTPIRLIALLAFLSLGHAAAQSNLIQNGNAEAVPGGTVDGFALVTIPGWTLTNNATLSYYDAPSFPTSDGAGPLDRGKYFFSGGDEMDVGTFTQLVNVTALSEVTLTAGYNFALSGYFGGFEGQEDNAVLTATSLDSGMQEISHVSIGGVTAADRNNETGLLARALTGAVPAATNFIRFTLICIRTEGSYNDGYADNLSFVLTPKGEFITPNLQIFQVATDADLQWQTQAGAQYQIQESDNLTAWTNLGASVTGTGALTTYSEPISPNLRRFYRLAITGTP